MWFVQVWTAACLPGRGFLLHCAAQKMQSCGRCTHLMSAAWASPRHLQTPPLFPAAVRYLDELRHVSQQATRAEAAFKPRQLELLALILRCDVLHKHGSKFLSGGSWLSRLL